MSDHVNKEDITSSDSFLKYTVLVIKTQCNIIQHLLLGAEVHYGM